MSTNITKKGQLYTQPIEPYLTLADGSNWQLMMFHLVDGGTRLFSKTNATYCNEYGLFSRLAWIDDYQYDGKYEFYVKQDGVEHRWTQTSAPTASSIAGMTVITGNPRVGLAKAASGTSGNTYIGYNSWWGACGCWTSYALSGKTGIPGFGPNNASGICADYLALYTRIDKFQAFGEDYVMNETILYEY